MLGPLPTFYRVTVSVCALLSFIGTGAWVSYLMPGTALASIGTGVGAGLGAVVAMLLLRDPHHPAPSQRVRARVRSHRPH